MQIYVFANPAKSVDKHFGVAKYSREEFFSFGLVTVFNELNDKVNYFIF